jgi:hypothetical protein
MEPQSPNPPATPTPPAAPPPSPWPPAPESGPGQPAIPPGMMLVPIQKPPVTTLARVGALFLATTGLLAVIIGALFVILGRALTGNNSVFDDTLGDVAGVAFVVLGAIIVVFFGLQFLAGIFAWRGSGVARVIGVIYGLFFGLLGLAGTLNARGAASGVRTGGGVLGVLIAVGYLYTAIVFIAAWRRKA